MPGRAVASARTRSRRRCEGAVLVEFAILTILLWLLLAGVLEVGRALAAQQLLQNAASAAARDLSLLELPVTARFGDSGGPRDAIFDDRFLVADQALLARCGPDPLLSRTAVERYFDQQGVPVLNRLLLPLWIRDDVEGVEVLRYPGAVLRREDAAGGCADGSVYTVRIPELLRGGAIEWREVVEPLPVGGSADPFPFAAGGWASLQIRYPFQAAAMQGWRAGSGGGQDMVDAVDPVAAPPLGLAFVATGASGTYAGRYGLGVLHAWGRDVRPYRRVLAAGAAFRREVFAP